ncbi:MAG: tail fiber domain-containing protein [Patescibacteria group bacterium]
MASITNGSGISGGDGGSEGAALTLALGATTADWNQTGAFDIIFINAGGAVDVQDNLTADSLTADTGGVTVAAGQGIDVGSAGALTIGNSTATSLSLCNSAACDTITIGTNADADAITIGEANDTVIITSANWSIDTNGDLIVNGCTGCGGGGGAPTDATYLVTSADGTLSAEVVVSSLGANLTFSGDDAAARTITLGQTGTFDDLLVVDAGNFLLDSSGNITTYGNLTLGDAITDGITVTGAIQGATPLSFDGATDDTNELTFAITDPTADRTVTFRNASGTVILSGDTFTGDVTATLDSDGSTALTIASDSVALSTDTTGNYVASITNGSGISGGDGGSEGAALTLALGALTADWNQTGAFDIIFNNADAQLQILESVGGTFYGTIDVGDLSGDATYTFSGSTGTVLTTGNYTGTLNSAYLQIANDLSDLNDAATARTNLGLGTGDSPQFTGLTLTGTLAVNGDSITSDGATLTINAGGAVDVQDNLTADSLTADTGGVTVAAGQGIDVGSAGALTIGNSTATSLSLCNSAACDTVTIGTNADADAITIGEVNDTVIITSANWSIDTNGDLIVNGCTGCGGGGVSDLQGAYEGGNSIETASDLAVVITETTGASTTGNLLELTFNPATGGNAAGDALLITLDAVDANGTDGNGIHIIIDQSQNTGNAILIEDDVGTDLFSVNESGMTLVSAGTTAAGLDTVVAGTLSLGTTNATAINICASASCDTINIGTATDGDTINIGDTNGADTLNVRGALSVNNSINQAITLHAGTATITVGSSSSQSIDLGYTTNGSAVKTLRIGAATSSSSTAINGGTGGITLTSTVATGTTTTSAFVVDAGDITTGTGLYLISDSVTTGRLADIATSGNTWTGNGTTNGLVNITSTSTAGSTSSSSILQQITRSGTNSNASHTAYGTYVTVTNTGTTSTNIAGYFSASGATNNYGLVVPNGLVGIGTAAPTANLMIVNLSASTSGVGTPVIDATGQKGLSCTASAIGSDSAACSAGALLTITTGAGGDNTSSSGGATSVFAGGAGGAVTVTSGSGGDSTSVATSQNWGGTGGAFTVTSGTGGSGADRGGVGGTLSIVGGDGGASSGGSGGNGGNIYLQPGAGGSGGGGDGTPGQIFISSTTQYGQRLCFNGSDGATQTDVAIGDCSSGGADYAEMYPLAEGIEAGELVSIGTQNVTTKDGDVIKQLVRSEIAYDGKVIGVVSRNTDDGSVIGLNIEEEDNPMPVALVGRVLVKIATNSFPIEPGDLLTTSTQPGRAMKATQPGQTIGRALQEWDPDNPSDEIMIFVGTSYADANNSSIRYKTDVGGLTFSLADLNKLQPHTFTWKNTGEQDFGFIAEEVAEVAPELAFFKDGQVEGVRYKLLSVLLTKAIQEQQVLIDNIMTSLNVPAPVQGNNNVSIISAPSTGNVNVIGTGEFTSDNVGQVSILPGDDTVEVTFDQEYKYQPIVTVTPRGITALSHQVPYAVFNESTKGFEIRLDVAQNVPMQFNWHAFSAKGAKVFISDGTTLEVNVKVKDPVIQKQPEIVIEDEPVDEEPEIIIEDEPVVEETPTEEESIEEIPEEETPPTEEEITEEPPVEEEITEELPAEEETIVEGGPDEGEEEAPPAEEPHVEE